MDDLLEDMGARYAADPEGMQALLAVGAKPFRPELDASAVVSWTIVAHTLMSLDEAVTLR